MGSIQGENGGSSSFPYLARHVLLIFGIEFSNVEYLSFQYQNRLQAHMIFQI